MKSLLTLSLLIIVWPMMAQDHLLTPQDIERNETSIIRTIEKLQEKPKKERLKNNFTTAYAEFLSVHTTRLQDALTSELYSSKNWERILNEMATLQYVGKKIKISEATDFVSVKDYAQAIDSITYVAANEFYEKGKAALANDAQYEAAYHISKRTANIKPDYLNTSQLLQHILASGTKNVFFAPVTNDNIGNFVDFGKASVSSDFIIQTIVNDLSRNMAGSVFQTREDSDTDWVVSMKWLSVNFSPERKMNYTRERKRTIKEDGKDLTVTATVDYTEKSKTATGTLQCEVVNKRNNTVIVNKNFPGSFLVQTKVATYKGDKRALMLEDEAAIENAKIYSDNMSQAINRMYQESIHQQFLLYVGKYLNWNYEPGR